ncbi:hypothetical protein ABIE48_003222 [Paenibacillus sp. OAE614]
MDVQKLTATRSSLPSSSIRAAGFKHIEHTFFDLYRVTGVLGWIRAVCRFVSMGDARQFCHVFRAHPRFVVYIVFSGQTAQGH